MNRLDAHTEHFGEHRDRHIPSIEVTAQVHPPKLTRVVNLCPVPISPGWRYPESPQRRLSGMANRIKELREQRGLTLQQVADAAGTSLQQIQRLENGHRRLTDDWMRRIAPALGVHPAALLLELPPQKHSFKEGVDDVLLLEWWHTLDLPEQMGWIARFSQETRRASAAAHHAKKRKG